MNSVKNHLIGLWREPTRIADFQTLDFSIEVFKWDANIHPEEVNFYTTVGMSNHRIFGFDPLHRIELFIGLTPSKDEIAERLAHFAYTSIRDNLQIGDNHSMTFSAPLWNNTKMDCLLLSIPNVEIVPTLLLEDGVHVSFLQMIPLFPSELEYKKANGVDDFWKSWQSREIPFWDSERLPSF